MDWSVVAVDFGQRLKELRVQAGMTQLQLAQRMGVTKSVVSFYELQERTPSPDILVKLSGIFKVSTDYLLGLDPRETIDISGLSREDIAIMRALAESLRRKSLYNHGE
ncbi:MAG: helix-turn-helix domain-containing protein [Oscillospiraceae bacterium]|mgnify:FL=1